MESRFYWSDSRVDCIRVIFKLMCSLERNPIEVQIFLTNFGPRILSERFRRYFYFGYWSDFKSDDCIETISKLIVLGDLKDGSIGATYFCSAVQSCIIAGTDSCLGAILKRSWLICGAIFLWSTESANWELIIIGTRTLFCCSGRRRDGTVLRPLVGYAMVSCCEPSRIIG